MLVIWMWEMEVGNGNDEGYCRWITTNRRLEEEIEVVFGEASK